MQLILNIIKTGDNMENYKTLKNNPLFKNMDDDEIKELLRSMHYREENFDKDEYIFYEGDLLKDIGVILNGEIMVLRDNYFGQRNIIANLKKGDIFGESVALVDDTIAPASTLVAKDAKILWLNTENLKNISDNKFIINLLELLARKNLFLNMRIRTISHRSLREKILVFLDNQRLQNNSDEFDIPFSRAEMADFLVVDRASLSRELSKLQEEGVIKFKKNNFKILKRLEIDL